MKLFRNIIMGMAAVIAVSCLGIEEDEKVYTAAEEILRREAYLDSLVARDYDIDTTDLGVYYVTVVEGEGEFAKSGDTLTVGYTGYFIDGRKFDSSNYYPDGEMHTDGKMTFVLENPSMLKGWDDGLKVMNKGSRVQLIVPSELAYKDIWYGNIPPYHTLIFMIELYDIKPSS